MKPLVSKSLIWQRELSFAQDPAFWLRFALEASACASFLDAQWNAAVLPHSGDAREAPPAPKAFFAPKFVRLLMGIALENAVKGLLLTGPDRDRFIKGDRISFQKHGHDLVWLFQQAAVPLSESESSYVAAWACSAEWFGKYPFPLGASGVLDEPQPLQSSDALSRRVLRGKRKFMDWDLLHTGIGSEERAVFEAVFGKLAARHSA